MRQLTLALLAAALLASCGDGGTKREIRTAAYGYLDAMGNYRTEEAVPYASRHTREESIPVLALLISRCDTAYIHSNTPAEITVKRVRMLSDTSAYAYYHKHTPITEQEDSLLMVLEEGRWLAEVRLGPIPGFVFMDSSSVKPFALPGK